MWKSDAFRCQRLSDNVLAPIPEHLLLALGNFDGVHLAHQAMLSEMKSRQKQNPGSSVAVFCFEKDSDEYLSKNPHHLTSLEEKLQLFSEYGVEYVLLADFDKCRNMTGEEFENMLFALSPDVQLFCGYNFRYGKNAMGTAESLIQRFGNALHVMSEYCLDGERVSSTRIRCAIADGDIALAKKMLGRAYTLTNTVTRGKQLGRTLGFPTANTEIPEKMTVPAFGAYVTKVTLANGKSYRGLTNVGDNPTVEKGIQPRLETYILGFSGDLYGEKIAVSFLEKIRGEVAFSSVEALQKQMQKDLQIALNYEE